MSERSVDALGRDEIMRILSSQSAYLSARFRVRKMGLFGSFARDEGSASSDIDVLVAMDQVTFDSYMDLKFFLEDLLGRPVDLVLEESLKPRLRHTVPGQAIYVEGLQPVS